MEYENISVTDKGHYAIITIDRPKVLNALDSSVLQELTDAVNELELSDEIRAVVLTGAGEKAFVAGADISEMRELGPREARELAERGGHLGELIENSSKPYIAAVNGFALGGGCELALACDFIYASSRAKFGQPEVKLGVIPGFGGTQRLARRIGLAKAKELIYTGDIIRADEALRIGLCDFVTDTLEGLMEKVAETAGKIAGNGPLAITEAKRVMHMGQSMSLEASIAMEQHAFGGLFASDDQAEGMSAFLEKREPEFQGR